MKNILFLLSLSRKEISFSLTTYNSRYFISDMTIEEKRKTMHFHYFEFVKF